MHNRYQVPGTYIPGARYARCTFDRVGTAERSSYVKAFDKTFNIRVNVLSLSLTFFSRSACRSRYELIRPNYLLAATSGILLYEYESGFDPRRDLKYILCSHEGPRTTARINNTRYLVAVTSQVCRYYRYSARDMF